jgi:hypothetical protein
VNVLPRHARRRAARSAGRIAAACAIAAGIGVGVTGDYSSSPGVVQRFIPADYAFAIWTPIYAGGAVFAARQVAGDVTRSDARTRAPLAWAFLLSGLWARVEDPAANLAVISATWASAALALWRLGRPERAHPLPVEATVGLLAGWVTLAAAVGMTEAVQRSGWSLGVDPASVEWAVGALTLAGAAAVGLTAARRTPWYPAAVVWGLVSVALGYAVSSPPVATTAAVLAAATALTAAMPGVRRQWTAGRHARPVHQ